MEDKIAKRSILICHLLLAPILSFAAIIVSKAAIRNARILQPEYPDIITISKYYNPVWIDVYIHKIGSLGIIAISIFFIFLSFLFFFRKFKYEKTFITLSFALIQLSWRLLFWLVLASLIWSFFGYCVYHVKRCLYASQSHQFVRFAPALLAPVILIVVCLANVYGNIRSSSDSYIMIEMLDSILEKGGVSDGDYVTATIKPSDMDSDYYTIVSISKI